MIHRDCIPLLQKCTGSLLHFTTSSNNTLKAGSANTIARAPSWATGKLPPVLPPRPVSMLVQPQQVGSTSTEDLSSSGFKGTENGNNDTLTRSGSVPLPPPDPLLSLLPLMERCGSDGVKVNPEYVNTNTADHSWFVGDMDRESANRRLEGYPMCTYLVRCRLNSRGDRVGYALSLKTEKDVKHMKICEKKVVAKDHPSDGGTSSSGSSSSSLFYLSDTRKFGSVVELVAWYGRHSLRESFSGLDTTLRFSVGELLMVEALYEFSPALSDRNMLPMKPGDVLTVIDKATGDSQGWWKACSASHRIGYIPKDFVKPMEQAVRIQQSPQSILDS